MSEQSLQQIEHEVPKFTELEVQDWGRDVMPPETEGTPPAETKPDVSRETTQEPPEADELAEVARGRGWVPKEEWKGPEERWVDARAFNDRYESVLPVVQRENKKLNSEVGNLRSELAELRKKATEWEGFQAEQAKSQAQLRVDTLKMERKNAIETQDWDTLVRVDDELLNLRVKEATAPARPTNGQQVDPVVQRTLQEFVTENPIFKDQEMGQVLAEAATVMRQAGSILTGREFLDKCKERVERLYPERFRSAPRRAHAMAETSGTPSGQRSTGKVWTDMKPEWREANERFIKTTPGVTREDILKNAPPEAFR